MSRLITSSRFRERCIGYARSSLSWGYWRSTAFNWDYRYKWEDVYGVSAAASLQRASIKIGLIGTVHHDLGDRILPAQRTTPEADELHAYLGEMKQCDCDAAVMEVSSHAIDMKRVSALLFDVVLFTNLSHDHLDYHADMEDYFRVKCRLFSQTKENAIAVVNGDDAYGQRLIKELSVPVITFGENAAAQVRAERIKTHAKKHAFMSILLGVRDGFNYRYWVDFMY